MAAIIALPSEGKSAAYLMFNVEMRGITSGQKSKYTQGECVYSISQLLFSDKASLLFLLVLIILSSVPSSAQVSVFWKKRHVSHIQPLQHWNMHIHSMQAPTMSKIALATQ